MKAAFLALVILAVAFITNGKAAQESIVKTNQVVHKKTLDNGATSHVQEHHKVVVNTNDGQGRNQNNNGLGGNQGLNQNYNGLGGNQGLNENYNPLGGDQGLNQNYNGLGGFEGQNQNYNRFGGNGNDRAINVQVPRQGRSFPYGRQARSNTGYVDE